MATANAISYPEQDYEILETALLESRRGRWFLETYAHRNGRTQTTEVLSSIARLADLVERQEATLNSILNPADMSLVKKALSIVEQYLATGEKNTLVGLAHDLEQNDEMLSTASENLILAAATLKMGKVSDTIFAQIIAEAERIQDARQHAQSAKNKIAALFQSLSLLEGHLRKLCGDISMPEAPAPLIPSAESAESGIEDATDMLDAPEAQFNLSEPTAGESAEATQSVIVEDIDQQVDTETDIDTEDAADSKNLDASKTEDDGDDFDDDSGSGSNDIDVPQSEELTEAEIEALFAKSEIAPVARSSASSLDTVALNTEVAAISGHFPRNAEREVSSLHTASTPSEIQKQKETLIVGERLAEKMVGKIKNSFQAKIAEQQLRFFTASDGINLSLKPA